MTVPSLVAEDWALDPLEPAGAEELYRRVEGAEPRRVRRADLEDHVGLTVRELYELGCTPAPLDLGSAGAMVGWRIAVVVGAVLSAFGLAGGVAGGMVPLLGGLGDPSPLAVERGLGIAVVFLAIAAGGRALLGRGVGALRRLAARRRVGRRTARRAELDPHARATVAAVRGPGVLRVQLLWLRGDPEDAAYAELRVLGEVRVEEDDAGRAEDAIARLSEVALRADNAHALRMGHGLGAPAQSTSPALEAADVAGPRNVRRKVGHAWEPDPLTDDGAGEVARRLSAARAERWTAEALAPLLVDRPVPAPADPPPWPRDRRRRGTRVDLRRPLRWAAWLGLTTFVLAMFWGDAPQPSGAAIAVGCLGLAVAGAAAVAPRLLARLDPAQRLVRAVRAAAANPPRALEQSLPGAGGLFEVACGRGRIALLHIRAARNDGRSGELEVRTLAWRELDTADPDALQQFWTVADGARARSESVGRSVAKARALLQRLGRVPARAGERGLAREPVAWLAALALAVLVAASIKHTVAGTWVAQGAGNRVVSYAWPLFAGVLALQAARRIRDPYAG
jgi:hypothetical protein